MTTSYSVATARARLSELLDQVEGGREVELTRRGETVAVLISAARYARLRGERAAFMTAFETFRAEHDLREVGVEPDWATALRDPSPGRRVKL